MRTITVALTLSALLAPPLAAAVTVLPTDRPVPIVSVLLTQWRILHG